jgi:hypothetical protein
MTTTAADDKLLSNIPAIILNIPVMFALFTAITINNGILTINWNNLITAILFALLVNTTIGKLFK